MSVLAKPNGNNFLLLFVDSPMQITTTIKNCVDAPAPATIVAREGARGRSWGRR